MTDVSIPDATTTVVDTGGAALQPLVEHTERITKIEQEAIAREERLNSAIASTRDELMQALDSARTEQAAALQDKLTRLEELQTKLEDLLTRSAPPAEPVPPTGIPATPVTPVPAPEPEIEPPPTKADERPKGTRGRRHARRAKMRGE